MNRTDRLLAIVLELQARRYTRAEDLAAQFEVSVRTIYRDVLALCEAGVPVVSTPGYGYMLTPGYFLPPLMLTPDEASLLLLGAAFVADHVDPASRQAIETARKKIEKLLPEATRRQMEALRSSMWFVSRPAAQTPEIEEKLATIRRAIAACDVLHLRYHARRGEPGERDVEPHGLVFVDGRWMVTAYCRVRQAMRNFRLDRIDGITRTGERFTRRDFTLPRQRPIELGKDDVRVLLDDGIVRWAREDRPYSFVREEQHADGVVMVFRPRDLSDIVPWLLSWGAGIQVLSPPELRHRIGAIAQAMVQRATTPVEDAERAGSERAPETVGAT